MEKNKTIIILLAIIIVALMAYIIFGINSSHPVSQPVVSTQNIVQPTNKQTTTSHTSTAAVPKTIPVKNSALIATNIDPYPASHVVGSASYLLVQQPIGSDGTMKYYFIYTNPDNGTAISDKQTIYYNPPVATTIVKFGANATSSTADFIKAANLKISQNGYVVVSHFTDGGPQNESYTIAQ